MKKENDIIVNYELLDYFQKEGRLHPCLFLDRDGVIIEDRHYIKKEEDVILEKGAYDLISKAHSLKWIIVVITNQSGIARGLLNWEDYKSVTSKMISFFEFGNPFTAIYSNSLKSGSSFKTWRKPSPEMILQALKDIPIDIKKTILIGDRISDIEAGLNANINKLFHVKTGHGVFERKKIMEVKSFSKLLNKISKKNGLSKLNLINNLEEFPSNILNYQKNNTIF
tara:strand:- start:582 stop:1256 length:675 start_codon:yes stop_codon:yes gene_type:complete